MSEIVKYFSRALQHSEGLIAYFVDEHHVRNNQLFPYLRQRAVLGQIMFTCLILLDQILFACN